MKYVTANASKLIDVTIFDKTDDPQNKNSQLQKDFKYLRKYYF